MKNKHLLFAITLVLTIGLPAFAQVRNDAKILATGEGTQTVKDLDPQNAATWLTARRVNQYSGTINVDDVVKAQEQVKALLKKGGNSLGMTWTELGPNNIGGRTRAFLIDKDNSDVCFAGSASGGLWKSTTGGTSWEKVPNEGGGLFENLAVSSICQAANGDIYYGTGEGPANTLGDPQNDHQGIYGQGIWKSTNHGASFSRLASTWSDADSKAAFIMVFALSTDPANANRIFAATAKGLRLTTDGGQTWVNPIAGVADVSHDVKVASDGTVLACVGKMAYKSANGEPGSFTKISATDGIKNSLIQDKDVSRMMFAFSPSDPNYVYCLAAGTTKTTAGVITGYPLSNIFQSKDKGTTWKVIGPGGSGSFQPLGTEGNYSMAIDVDPANPGFILIGGNNVYSWSYKTGWERISLDEPTDMPNRGFYVHRDQHTIVFSKTNPHTVYIGTSGGILVSDNRGTTFRTLNRNYNVTQYLTVAFAPSGEVLGGTMDSGILYMDFQGNDPKYASWWGGGVFDAFLSFRHGGECEISTLDPNYKFYTTPGGNVHRRLIIENQVSYQNYYSYANGGAWLSPIALWESFNDPMSWDSVLFIADRAYNAGESVTAQSMIRKLGLTKVLDKHLDAGDTLKIQDTYQAMFVVGKYGKASSKVNRHPLSGTDTHKNQFYTTIERGRIQDTDLPVEVVFSADGKFLFVAMWDNSEKLYKIYRVSNMENARDRRSMDTATGFDPITGLPTYVVKSAIIGSFNQVITSISVDPTNSDNVVVTCGNYGNPNYVYLSTAATTTKDSVNSFVPIQGNLPQAPVYTAMYNWRDHNELLVGTEYGVYSTRNLYSGTPEWSSENGNGMEILPVFDLRQQQFANNAEFGIKNHGVVYAATFGRGVFTSETFSTKGGASSSHLAGLSDIEVQVTPNPVSDLATLRYTLDSSSNVEFQVYNLQGKLVKTININNQPAGSNELTVDASGFGSGTYLVRMIAGTSQASTKFIIK